MVKFQNNFLNSCNIFQLNQAAVFKNSLGTKILATNKQGLFQTQ